MQNPKSVFVLKTSHLHSHSPVIALETTWGLVACACKLWDEPRPGLEIIKEQGHLSLNTHPHAVPHAHRPTLGVWALRFLAHHE